MMKINVKTILGEAYSLELLEGATLGDLRQATQNAKGIPPNQQRYLVLTSEENDTLPYGQQKMNTFVTKWNDEGRFLKGVDLPISKWGIKENTTLLQVLTLGGNNDDAPESQADRVQKLFRRAVFDDYVLQLDEVKEISEILKSLKPSNKKFDSLTSYTCSCVGRAIYPQPEFQELNLGNIFWVMETLKTATDAHFVDSLFDVLIGAAKANIDGMILKMLDKGALEVGRRFVVDRHVCLASDYDTTEYPPHARTKLQNKAIEFLKEIQRNHEPVRGKVADIIYGELFRKEGVFVIPNHGFHIFNPENEYLWDEARKLFGSEKLFDYQVTFKAIKGVQLAAKDSNGLSDPYFVVSETPKHNKEVKPQFKSHAIKKTLNPEWDLSKEKKLTAVVTGDEECLVQVFDQDLLSSDFMGQITFMPRVLYSAMRAEKKDTITLVGLLGSVETKKSGLKFRDVSGWLYITVGITHNDEK